ncbi:hypothetical protein ACFP2T_33690 [Plantactinospora solaniradicis]|uniref:Transposase IS30-like HTH domain-containing protein n=1 Tax=Plantactinospora solaniradicis TaxID=1723736 RepID=A0ABW1KKZ2_9ACTN
MSGRIGTGYRSRQWGTGRHPALEALYLFGGRPTVINADRIRSARDLLPNPDASVASIARLLGVSPGTLYNPVPDSRELRAAGRVRGIGSPSSRVS